MRYLKLFFIAALFFSFYSCDDDDDTIYPAPVDQMEMKVWFSALPNPELGFLPCAPQAAGIAIPTGGYIQGHATQIDEVNSSLSPYTIENCYLRNADELVEVIKGTITNRRGDTFRYRGQMVINFAKQTIGGDMTILEGTGKMEGATGTVHTSGTLDSDTGTASWTGFGIITFTDDQ